MAKRYADKRRTKIGGAGGEEVEFDAEAFIVDEDATVDPHARRLAEARARGQGPRRRPACARATRCWPRVRGSTQGAGRVLLEPRQRLRHARSTTCRPRPATASRCRSCSSSTTASASSARSLITAAGARQGGRCAVAVTQAGATACASPSIRTASCRPGPAAASPSRARATRSSASRSCQPERHRLHGHQRRARAALQGRGDHRAGRPGPRRHRHQGRTTTSRGRLRRRRPQGQGRHHRRDRRAARSCQSARAATRSPRAAARATRSSASTEDRAASTPARADRRRRRCSELTSSQRDVGDYTVRRHHRSSRASSRSATAPACTSAAPTARGYHHLLWEIVDNSVDEVDQRLRHAHRGDAAQGPQGASRSTDDGRGIPVDIKTKYKKSALELILTTLHAGGKFSRRSTRSRAACTASARRW